MVNGGYEKLKTAAREEITGKEQPMSTQNDGRSENQEEENFPTQSVALREPQAILRFKEANIQREVRLQLPTEPNSTFLINLGRLKSNDLNSTNYQQLVGYMTHNAQLTNKSSLENILK